MLVRCVNLYRYKELHITHLMHTNDFDLWPDHSLLFCSCVMKTKVVKSKYVWWRIWPHLAVPVVSCLNGRDRIVVSTSRCGRDNPGSNPGHGRGCEVSIMALPDSNFSLHNTWTDNISCCEPHTDVQKYTLTFTSMISEKCSFYFLSLPEKQVGYMFHISTSGPVV